MLGLLVGPEDVGEVLRVVLVGVVGPHVGVELVGEQSLELEILTLLILNLSRETIWPTKEKTLRKRLKSVFAMVFRDLQ